MRSFKLGFVVLGGVLISLSCGKVERSGNAENSAAEGGSAPQAEDAAGAAGEAVSAPQLPPPVACGIQSCKAIAFRGNVVAPCCSDPSKGICGADVSALVPNVGCQPLTQDGTLDRSCPSSSGVMSGGLGLVSAPGCCNAATHQCGYWISNLGGLLPFAPGCVNAQILGGAGGAPQACGAGVGITAGQGSGAAAGEGGASSAEAGAAGMGATAGVPSVEVSASGGDGGSPAASPP